MEASIKLSPELSARLDALVEISGQTRAFHLRQIVAEGLSEMEDYYLAISTRDRVNKGEEAVHSAASVREDLGLAD